MNVVITMQPNPQIDGDAIFFEFVAVGKPQGESPFRVGFRVQYAWGSTLAQRRTAILNAANTAKQQYEEAHGVTLPTVNATEVFGIS